MPFAGFKNFEECINKQLKSGHSKESAEKICGYLKHKFEPKNFENQVSEEGKIGEMSNGLGRPIIEPDIVEESVKGEEIKI